MGWKDLLQKDGETLVTPWLGGRSLRSGPREWKIEGRLPEEHGWATFTISSRTATLLATTDAAPEALKYDVKGFLVGDRVVSDSIAGFNPSPQTIISVSETVHLLEPGLDRFVRIVAGRMYEDGPLIFKSQLMPLGPETDVLNAFLDKKTSVTDIAHVPPALDAAFRMESWQRDEAERRRLEAERRRREEEEKRALEERRQKIIQQLGDAQGRREMARIDFGEAARSALAVGDAEYLDHRKAARRNEMIVRFRINRRRFECTCDATTLQIIDSGICLTAHHDDPDFKGGTKGDTWFTLESLPSVIREAEREHRLVVYRHADG
jgi:hypothetical protein